MSYYKFAPNDLFYNRIKTYPSINFHIYNGIVVYNNETQLDGMFSTDVKDVRPGFISLYELNIDRATDQLIYPFVTKEGSLTSFKTISTTNFNSDFSYGDIISGSYPLSASISTDHFAAGVAGGAAGYYRSALRNRLNNYTILSPAFAFSSSLGDKGTQELSIISVPSIFYGSSLKKGSVSLKFFITGTLISELRDDTSIGELRQVSSGSSMDSGSVGGVVMYNEGFIILTGSWDLAPVGSDIYYGPGATAPRWIDFGYTGVAAPSSSFQMSFSGTNYIPTMTMFAHMPKGELNYSNNPTFLKFGQSGSLMPISGATSYKESSQVVIENIVKTNFPDPDGRFEKTTYINKVGIYDEYKNLIGVANLANPIRKRETDEFTLKLKLDF